MGFEEQFGEIAANLSEVGDHALEEAARFELARSLIGDALRLIRETAPAGIDSAHAWLGAIQIVDQFAHEAVHDALDAESG
jgi:hypothetical protein